MSKLLPLLALGFGLITFGGFWYLFDGVRSYFESFLITGDVYCELQYLGFRAMPVIVVVIGIFCLIAAGVMATRDYSEVDY